MNLKRRLSKAKTVTTKTATRMKRRKMEVSRTTRNPRPTRKLRTRRLHGLSTYGSGQLGHPPVLCPHPHAFLCPVVYRKDDDPHSTNRFQSSERRSYLMRWQNAVLWLNRVADPRRCVFELSTAGLQLVIPASHRD